MRTNFTFELSQHCRPTTALMFVLSVASILYSFSGRASAAAACEPKLAHIVSKQGIVELRRAGETLWRQAAAETMLCPGDALRVRAHSRAALRLSNDSMLRLDQKTTVIFPPAQEEASTLLDLLNGALHILTRTPKPFKIRTPFVNAAVEGTEFVVSIDADSTKLVVYEGRVSASNDRGTLVLTDREAAVVRQHDAPEKVGMVNPVDGVQWALHYPTIIDYRLDEALSADPAWPEIQASIDYYRQGQFYEALAILEQVPPRARSVPFLNFYAGLLLTVGRADEARAAIENSLQLLPDNSTAYALLAIMAVVQNDKDQALEQAHRAVALDPESAPVKLALSYAQQAHFEVEAALASVQAAVKADTQNALAWARQAELQMATGQLDLALESAHQAVNLNPALAKTQTVLGFAHLLRIDTDAAKAVFSQALLLDQTNPMPRLGLGLALIREGALEAGRIELEIAVSLDPANSLIRSYLGKAYFEEKRYPLASTQFDMAKARDPNDPTPWFYDAIQKQTQNRPVEALQDIQKSIELNDNRAVYRSRLLLDQDQAGRGSSLARIYDNLGFEQRATMETAKSLSYDPSNHSAHRFLSDAYRNIPRHEIARVSELLQAQLLQPINVNPVQPRLAVADLNMITHTGPTAAGFNEFTPLMERNKPQLVASGIVGSDSTIGNEVVASMLYDRASISVGQFHYETDGFRPNNDQNHNIYNAFMQYAVTPKFNVQAEVRRRETEHGNLLLDFDRGTDDLSPEQNRKRRVLNDDTARVGARYALSPRQDLIISAMYADRKEKLVSSDSFNPTTDNLEVFVNGKGYQTESQYQFRGNNFNVIAGAGTYRTEVKEKWQERNNNTGDIKCEFEECFPDFIRERNSGYLYTNFHLNSSLNTTFGFNYDSYAEKNLDIERFNPKLGLQWNIVNNFRLRLAWFETIKSALIFNQTLEPTQVAGFNQMFDDVNGTKARRMGIGIDTHVANTVFSGFEISRRDLDVPIIGNDNDDVGFEEQKENLYRAYLYWVPHENWVFKGEALIEKFSRAKTLSGPHQIDTLSTPLSVNYFNQLGLFFNLTGTYVRQKVNRENITTFEENINHENEGIENFFLFDAALGYRFPNRMGIVSLEGRNLLDEQFLFRNVNFQTAEPTNSRFVPSRTFFARLTFNF
jgi:tetratricopeptide (TPR) repeat protein